jgi:MFS transporter, DHA2 family, multidrug resistance protein
VDAAAHLPDQLGALLLDGARQAFTQGLHLAFAVSAAATLGVAIAAAILLRHLRPSSGPEAPPDPEPTQQIEPREEVQARSERQH